jgi:PhnB protein
MIEHEFAIGLVFGSTGREPVMPDVKPIPENHPTVSPYLVIDGAGDAMDFYCSVLGATERMRMGRPDGRIGHAEVQLGDSVIMLSDEWPEGGYRGPKATGGTPVTMMAYVADVDEVFARALAEGATEIEAVTNKFYGDRSGSFEDPWGHRWTVATHIEDVPEEELERRATEAMGQAS